MNDKNCLTHHIEANNSNSKDKVAKYLYNILKYFQSNKINKNKIYFKSNK